MRKKLVKISKRFLILILLMAILLLIFPTWTPGIRGENSISTLGQVEINGAGHEVMIRGTNRGQPHPYLCTRWSGMLRNSLCQKVLEKHDEQITQE